LLALTGEAVRPAGLEQPLLQPPVAAAIRPFIYLL
jgi:hypothetical protein